MVEKYRSLSLGISLNLGIGIVFIIAGIITVVAVNQAMRRQAVMEAEAKARIILDRNLATHTYFSQIMKPGIFKWAEPILTKEHFDPTWMSSTYAVREIDKYFKKFNPTGYYFRDVAIHARSPENEADATARIRRRPVAMPVAVAPVAVPVAAFLGAVAAAGRCLGIRILFQSLHTQFYLPVGLDVKDFDVHDLAQLEDVADAPDPA